MHQVIPFYIGDTLPILLKKHNEDTNGRSNLLDGKDKRNGHLNMKSLGTVTGSIGMII